MGDISTVNGDTMAARFGSTPQWMGIPDFEVIHITPDVIATCLQEYLDQGSKITGVSLKEINLSVANTDGDMKKYTLVDCLKRGMKLFDALVWLSAGRPDEYPLTTDGAVPADKIPSLHEVAKALFYALFFVITQARYPYSGPDNGAPATPNFLKVVMGLDKSQSYYIDMLCSFNAVQFDMRWAKYVKFQNFGQETISRFGLGVAGYRLFTPFKLYAKPDTLDPMYSDAFDFAKKVAESKPTWDVHPATRDPAVLTSRGNLNKNLGNLILKSFTDEQIKQMVKNKVLYEYPSEDLTVSNYLTWKAVDDISGTNWIFPARG